MSEQQPFEQPRQERNKRFTFAKLFTPEVCRFMRTYRYTIIYMCVGLLLAIGLFTIGFWKTLLTFCLIYGGYVLGGVQDRNPRILYRIARFYKHWIQNNPFMK